MSRFLLKDFLDTYFCQNDIKSQTYFRAWEFVMKKFNSHTQNNYTILQVRKKWGDMNYQKRQKKVSSRIDKIIVICQLEQRLHRRLQQQ